MATNPKDLRIKKLGFAGAQLTAGIERVHEGMQRLGLEGSTSK